MDSSRNRRHRDGAHPARPEPSGEAFSDAQERLQSLTGQLLDPSIDDTRREALTREAVEAFRQVSLDLSVAEERRRSQEDELETLTRDLVVVRQRLRELFEQLPLAYATTDLDGRVTALNPVARRRAGDDADPSLHVNDVLPTPVDGWLAELRDLDGLRRRDLTDGAGSGTTRVVVAVARHRRRDDAVLHWVWWPLPSGHGIVSGDGDGESPPEAAPTPPAPRTERTWNHPLHVAMLTDHELFGTGLGLVLTELFHHDDVRITVLGRSGDDERLRTADPDVTVLDLTDEDDPVRAVVAVHGTHPGQRLLAVTRDDDPERSLQLLEAGAYGVVPRSSSLQELVGPILAVAHGWTAVPARTAARVTGNARKRRELLELLDPDELDLLARIGSGMTDEAIAQTLHVSSRTVKRRAAILFTKLGVSSRVEAAALAGVYDLLREGSENAY